MSWGTVFNAKDVFIIRQQFRNMQELDDRIKELNEEYDAHRRRLIGFATATPKDVTPNDEDPLYYTTKEVEEIVEAMSHITYQQALLELLKENFDTRENC